jgi:YVTN family beta-propeller protein
VLTGTGFPIPVGRRPRGVAVTPDGKHAYVTHYSDGTVSIIDTASNTVLTGTGFPITVGSEPFGVGIIPPVQFLAFSATLAIHFGGAPNQDTFNWHSQFTLSSTASNGINPVTEPVTLQVGTFGITIPPGSFTKHPNGSFTFVGVIGGVSLNALIKPTGTLRYAFHAAATARA